MQALTIDADLSITSETHQITVLSNAEEIGVAISGSSIPKLGISSFKALKLLNSLPEINLNQRLTVVFNQKEIYRSDKSLFNQSNKLLLAKIFLKNLF